MLVDLVQTTTRDDVRLDGIFLPARETAAKSLPLDSICYIHGTGGNFYSSSLFDDLTVAFLALGCAVLRVNTRGHDGISTAVSGRGARRQGSAYEVVDESRHDIAAWLAWLRERAGPRVGLLGHSSGALKCLYAVCHEPKLAPACIVAISPPRLSYSHFCNAADGPAFGETYDEAQRLVEYGNPAALMEVKVPLSFVVTAAGYVEKYGPDERYNFLNFIRTVPCPTLLTFGSIEVASNMAFAGLPEALAEIGKRTARIHVTTIAGADHGYAGVREALWTEVEAWVSRTC
jgi:pimeloyl-ACP methyl ester carboxylesterase